MKRAATILVLLAACNGDSADDYAEERARAEKAAASLLAELKPKLQQALGAGPPEDGLNLCAHVAQSISTEVQEREGVVVRRTSLKVRNPANVPDEEERAWLEAVRERKVLPTEGEAWISRGPDGGKELRFVRPIVMAKMCLQCHGDPEQLSPAVRKLLKKLYPDDRATGYKAGDLRGIVSVRVPIRAK